MGSTRKKGRNGAVYAPLVGRHVTCPTLQVVLMKGRRQMPALDVEGERITLPRDAELTDLEALVAEPGCYRVIARDPATNRQVGHLDHLIEHDSPAPVSSRPAHTTRRSTPTPYAALSEHAYLGHLHETINSLRDQLREMTARAERDIRYERERADVGIKAAQDRAADEIRLLREKHEAVAKQAFDANVKLSAYVARLDGRERRIDDLESQLAEMKEEVENAREVTAEMRRQAETTSFDPLSAIMQVDQALDLAAKAAARFSD